MAIIQKHGYAVDLSELQAICERNYVYLLKILPDIKQLGYSRRIALTFNQKITIVLIFTVLEISPYTSYLCLRQSRLLSWLGVPQLFIRCYHDVRMAEVTLAQNTRSFKGIYDYPNKAMHQPNEKRQLNSFLEEWLARCLSFGYETKLIELGSQLHE